jgi:hypothetical protein
MPQGAENTHPAETTPPSQDGPTALQLSIAFLVLGTSAGFTLYTKKVGSMLRTMKQLEENQLRNHPPKIGPQTKEFFEKMKPRIDKDEFY